MCNQVIPENLQWVETELFGKKYRSVEPRNWSELLYAIENDLLGQCKNTEIKDSVSPTTLVNYFDFIN